LPEADVKIEGNNSRNREHSANWTGACVCYNAFELMRRVDVDQFCTPRVALAPTDALTPAVPVQERPFIARPTVAGLRLGRANPLAPYLNVVDATLSNSSCQVKTYVCRAPSLDQKQCTTKGFVFQKNAQPLTVEKEVRRTAWMSVAGVDRWATMCPGLRALITNPNELSTTEPAKLCQ
jgi:hypothetical protein